MLLTEQSVRNENERLQEEVAHLRRELGLVRDRSAETAFAARWGLTGTEAKVLSHLFQKKGGLATKESTMDALYSGSADEPEIKIVDVFICKMRKKIGADRIETSWGRGYRLTPLGVEECAALLGLSLDQIERVPDEPAPPRRPREMSVGLRVLRAMQDKPKTIHQIAVLMESDGHKTHSRIHYLRKNGYVRVADSRKTPSGGQPTNFYGLTKAGEALIKQWAAFDAR
jgi:hypothetical protein